MGPATRVARISISNATNMPSWDVLRAHVVALAKNQDVGVSPVRALARVQHLQSRTHVRQYHKWHGLRRDCAEFWRRLRCAHLGGDGFGGGNGRLGWFLPLGPCA